MPQYVCAVNKSHTKWLSTPDSMQCCGKPMLIKQSEQQPQSAASVAQPAIITPVEPQEKLKKGWQFW